MDKNPVFYLIFICAYLVACSDKETKKSCYYSLDQLLTLDSPKAVIKTQNDSVIVAHDQVPDSAQFGMYIFDKQKRLRLYAYYLSKEHYRYMEEFDSTGAMINNEGSQLLEYRIWKKENDTILFNAYVFALNKKLEKIEIISNFKDTIQPEYLYKSDFTTNTSCFAFKLPVAQNINSLVLYYKGTFTNRCTHQQETYLDTTLFTEVKF
jgi:hypothetical protein